MTLNLYKPEVRLLLKPHQQNCQEVEGEIQRILRDNLQDLIRNELNILLLPILSFLSNLLMNVLEVQRTEI